ncbi:MAG TPA: hydantoinase/oxoprolinase family protein, partial [bacterium]|nr:hydantoinase/oxoprolinase family protein [bacterium]
AHVTLSHRSSPRIRLIPRADTAIADAYLTPVLQAHLDSLQSVLHDGGRLSMMTSAGGLTGPAQFTGRKSILSGPAGGMVALAEIARVTGYTGIIGFDMGGTSTDVSRYDGDFEYRYDTRISGIRLTTPMLHIETVAAGGGSICRFDGNRFRVGPESAGADPGPAAYGRGGPLTLTDVNAVLGYLPRFPFSLDMDSVRERFDSCRRKIRKATGQWMTVEEIAEGFRTIASETMAAAIRKISLARGYDTRDHVLTTFGGAGPQHACSLARLLGMETIIIHPLASVLSAYGLCVAPVKAIIEQPIMELYRDRFRDEWETLLTGMEASAAEQVAADGVDPG